MAGGLGAPLIVAGRSARLATFPVPSGMPAGGETTRQGLLLAMGRFNLAVTYTALPFTACCLAHLPGHRECHPSGLESAGNNKGRACRHVSSSASHVHEQQTQTIMRAMLMEGGQHLLSSCSVSEPFAPFARGGGGELQDLACVPRLVAEPEPDWAFR